MNDGEITNLILEKLKDLPDEAADLISKAVRYGSEKAYDSGFEKGFIEGKKACGTLRAVLESVEGVKIIGND